MALATLIKDAMRDGAVYKMVEAWYGILRAYYESAPDIAASCLRVIGLYAGAKTKRKKEIGYMDRICNV